MSKITKEQLDSFLRSNDADVEDIIEIIKEDYGSVLTNNNIELCNISEDRIEKMTRAISENKVIVEKVKKARQERDPEFTSYLRNKENFKDFLNEVKDGKA
ncbi:hypothetical protein [Radiobacillus sp. PE A8.2]|uniref:hypothetical protein n=1 Tax=Radiobacillus sp. PE A8.2 TaxID=3380349 RepID=UPI00388F3C5F